MYVGYYVRVRVLNSTKTQKSRSTEVLIDMIKYLITEVLTKTWNYKNTEIYSKTRNS